MLRGTDLLRGTDATERVHCDRPHSPPHRERPGSEAAVKEWIQVGAYVRVRRDVLEMGHEALRRQEELTRREAERAKQERQRQAKRVKRKAERVARAERRREAARHGGEIPKRTRSRT